MSLTILSWLVTSKIGRWVAVVGIVFAIIGLVMWRTFVAGQNAQAADQRVKQLENLKKKVQVDNEIRSMSSDDRRKQLAKWVRN